MKSLLQLSLRFATLSVLTVLVFFGGLIARLTQADPEAKSKLAKNFGVNTAHADFTTVTVEGVQGVVEGTIGSEGDACESSDPQGTQGDADDC